MCELFKELHKYGVKMDVKPNYILNTLVVKFSKANKDLMFMVPSNEVDSVIEPTFIEAYILKKLRDFVREVGE